jgi:hypothetical protein
MAAALQAETLDVKMDENGTSFMEVTACCSRSRSRFRS